MIRATETALAGYAHRAQEISRLAQKMAQPDRAEARDMVGLMVNQRAAEASLVVAHVADETTEALVHVIA
jgi:hypothetical protein